MTHQEIRDAIESGSEVYCVCCDEEKHRVFLAPGPYGEPWIRNEPGQIEPYSPRLHGPRTIVAKPEPKTLGAYLDMFENEWRQVKC